MLLEMPPSGSRRYDDQLTSYDYHVYHVCRLYNIGPNTQSLVCLLIPTCIDYFIRWIHHIGHFAGIQCLIYIICHYTIILRTNKQCAMSVSWPTISKCHISSDSVVAAFHWWTSRESLWTTVSNCIFTKWPIWQLVILSLKAWIHHVYRTYCLILHSF